MKDQEFCKENYFYHPDHLGSSSWITYTDGSAVQHLQYLPWGESFVDQRSTTWNAMYTFSAKEKDAESGYSYFGSRYYNSDLSIWLSVDPQASKYPSLSPYVYCANNPIKLVDPNGEEFDWVEKADGTIYWDDNATSQETTKEGEKYLGKNVLVANHGRDANLNEAVNGATFDLYLESDHTGPTASIVGNTVPCDVDAYGTLPEGLYDTKYNGLYNGEPSLRILQKNGESYYNPKRPAGDLPTVKGNPNNPANKGKDKSEHIMNGILFHLGNYGRESLTTSTGRPITEGCQTGKHGAGSKTEYQKFASNFVGKNGIIYYLRATPKNKTF